MLGAQEAVIVSTEADPGIVTTLGEQVGAEAVMVIGTVAVLPAAQDVEGQEAGEVTTDVITDAEQVSVPTSNQQLHTKDVCPPLGLNGRISANLCLQKTANNSPSQ